MIDWLKNYAIKMALPKLAPMIGRYAAGVIIGVLLMAANKFNITLDPADIEKWNTGLTLGIGAIVLAAGMSRLKVEKHADVGKAVAVAAKEAGVSVPDVIDAAVVQAAAFNARVEVGTLPDIKK